MIVLPATAAEAAAVPLGVYTSAYTLGTVLALAIVIDHLKFHDVSLAEAVAIRNAGEVAEHVIATLIWLDESKPTIVPATGDALGPLWSAATATTTSVVSITTA